MYMDNSFGHRLLLAGTNQIVDDGDDPDDWDWDQGGGG